MDPKEHQKVARLLHDCTSEISPMEGDNANSHSELVGKLRPESKYPKSCQCFFHHITVSFQLAALMSTLKMRRYCAGHHEMMQVLAELRENYSS